MRASLDVILLAAEKNQSAVLHPVTFVPPSQCDVDKEGCGDAPTLASQSPVVMSSASERDLPGASCHLQRRSRHQRNGHGS